MCMAKTDAVWWNRVRLEAKETKVERIAEQFVRNEIKSMKQDGAIGPLGNKSQAYP